jgi:tRNA threonylcarbamoyladenosine biosynthesis protein TsaB
MQILALDSSTQWLSIALGDGTHWHERAEHAAAAASERALPLVREVLSDARLALQDLDGIAFGAGPGAFTGVRIACGLAQGLALGAGLPVIGVSTLLALAQATWRASGHAAILACLDARMREVYVAAYRRVAQSWSVVEAPAVIAPAEMVAPPGIWHGAGDGFAAYPGLAQRLSLASVDPCAVPWARAVGELALPRFIAGEGVPAAEAEPVYVRHRVALTSAERDAGLRL